ncbi:LysR substrate-binding domain-containing protein [Candidatus Palauibacter sp.]|uniref:LysR substrate-binding domain-containing protein n=1 Tax=Candidatus Palauibacter sp. TaxID=3101350 RepID=UPI003AF2D378
MLRLPPLESLRFFEAAARHQSFARAASELDVTPAAVAHRIRTLEKHLEAELFDRRSRGVRLNRRGRAYLKEVQRILADVHGISQRHRREAPRVGIVSVEAVAERWLVPRLPSFRAAHPDIAIELETNHRGVDPQRSDFDCWLAYTGETSAPRPLTRREDTLLEETLYEEQLVPVCSPVLLAARGRLGSPAELHDWPLLYDLGWDADWSYWFARQGELTPDLSRASGFRLYSMVIQAAVNGIGAAIGRPMLIARELDRRTLVPIFDRQAEAPERCCLITTAASRHRPEVQAFRKWVLQEAKTAARTVADPVRTTP